MPSRKGWHLLFCMENNKICSFFGHRDVEINQELFERVQAEVIKAIHSGYNTFYFGGYGDFDALCYNTVTKLVGQFPSIVRVYCVTQEKDLRKKSRYFNAEDYDKIIFLQPAFDGWYKSIYYRNCAMIDASDLVIFFVQEHQNSGAYKAYKYAKKKSKQIINLYNIV